MADQQMVMYDQQFKQIGVICERLRIDSNARAIMLVDRNGQFITCQGDIGNLDTTSLASLTAGNIAATSGLAKIIGESEFPSVFHEGKHENLHLSVVAQRAILVVLFDKRSTLGLVKLRVRRAGDELTHVFESLLAQGRDHPAKTPFAEITDDDIDNLFAH